MLLIAEDCFGIASLKAAAKLCRCKAFIKRYGYASPAHNRQEDLKPRIRVFADNGNAFFAQSVFIKRSSEITDFRKHLEERDFAYFPLFFSFKCRFPREFLHDEVQHFLYRFSVIDIAFFTSHFHFLSYAKYI